MNIVASVTAPSCVISALLLAAAAAPAQSGYDLLQQALIKEHAAGELEAAIGIYRQIVTKFEDDRPLAAKALLRIGRCYEKLGKRQAVAAYETVCRAYAAERVPFAEATARLTILA